MTILWIVCEYLDLVFDKVVFIERSMSFFGVCFFICIDLK